MTDPLFAVAAVVFGVLSAKRVVHWIEAIAEYLHNAESKIRVIRILWFVATVLLILVTAVLSPLLSWIWGWKLGALFGVVTWSIFLGATGLLFLPPKAMTAVFGAILGVSLSDVSSGSGLIASANNAITELARQIGAVLLRTWAAGALYGRKHCGTSVRWSFIHAHSPSLFVYGART